MFSKPRPNKRALSVASSSNWVKRGAQYKVIACYNQHCHHCSNMNQTRRLPLLLPPLAAVLCDGQTCMSSDHETSSVTALLPPPVQRCGTVCLNSFGNRTSPLDNLNDRLKRLCLVSRVAAPCVWTLRVPTRNLLAYLLIYLLLLLDLYSVVSRINHESECWRWLFCCHTPSVKQFYIITSLHHNVGS